MTHVRRYRPEDREAVEDICVRTAHGGGDSRQHYRDPGIFPATFAIPYVVLEPDLAFVLDDGRGRAVGYVLGAADTPLFVAAFRTKWLPLVAGLHPEPDGPPRTPDEEMVRLLHHPSACSSRRSPTTLPTSTSTCCPPGRAEAMAAR
jgi:hypothetical protein